MDNKINKLKIILTAVTLVFVLVVLFMRMPSKDNKLIVLEKVWSEVPNFEENTKEYDIKLNQKLVISNEWGSKIEIEVIGLTNNSVTIKTSEDMCEVVNDKMDFSNGKTEFKIEKNSSIKLSTLTMDAGAIYTVEFK